jgi:hypothetical protein
MRGKEAVMNKLTRKVVKRGRDAARDAYQRVETRVLVAEGRKAVRNKTNAVVKVSRKAAKTGLVVGALTAAGVVLREVRKRRKLDRG